MSCDICGAVISEQRKHRQWHEAMDGSIQQAHDHYVSPPVYASAQGEVMSDDANTNEAPFPVELDELVDGMAYRPGWHFALVDLDRGQGSKGLTLDIVSLGYDTYHPENGEMYRVHHYFPVPPASFNRESWRRWLLECLIKIETHEVCEFLQLDGARPFAPNHGPGWDPYVVRELNTAEAAETSFKGERDQGSHG